MDNKMKNVAIKLTHGVLLSISALVFSMSSEATISVQVEQPDWQFVLKNNYLDNKHNKITREESEFVQSIQADLSSGNYQAVANAFANAFANLDSEKQSPRLLELYGQVLLNTKQYKQAITVLNKALAAMPNLAAAHRNISLAYLVSEQLEQAREHLVKSIELGLADAQLYGQLAYVNLQLGRSVSAVSGYQNAIFLDPNNPQWYQGLLFALIDTEATAQASGLVDELLVASPEQSRLWLQRGQIALKQGNTDKAIASLETAFSLGERTPANLESLAKLHISDGSPRRATSLLTDNIRVFTAKNNASGWQTLNSIGRYLASQQDWRNLKNLTQAANKQSKSLNASQLAQLHVLQAQVALANNQTSKARGLLQKSIDKAPSDGDALLLLAKLYRDDKKPERAKMYYIRAKALAEYKQQALLGLAQIDINQRQYQSALTLLRQVYQAYPERTDLLSNIQSLENLVKNTI